MNERNQRDLSTILTFDIGGTRIKSGVVRDGVLSSFSLISLEERDKAGGALSCVLETGQRLLTGRCIDAIGLSLRGIVDPTSGILLDVNGALSEYIGQPLATRIREELGVPVYLENDARMYALGELLYGAGQNARNMVCLTLGTGVGCGVAFERRILRGARGLGGILGGHITVQADGPLCSCGNRGCLEALIGSVALAEAIQREQQSVPSSSLWNGPATPLQLFEAQAAGDALAQELVARFSRHLGAGIVSLIHVYDPDIVIVGGGIGQSAAQFLAETQAYVNQHAWTLPRGRVKIMPARCGDTAALLGIAAFIQNQTVLH